MGAEVALSEDRDRMVGNAQGLAEFPDARREQVGDAVGVALGQAPRPGQRRQHAQQVKALLRYKAVGPRRQL